MIPFASQKSFRWVLVGGLLGTAGWGCSRTMYELFPVEDIVGPGSGGTCSVDDCGQGDGDEYYPPTTTTTDPTTTATTDIDTAGGDPGMPEDPCISTQIAGQPLQMLRFVESGRCVRQGDPTTINGEPAYLVVTGPCTQEPEAAWVPLEGDYGGLQFRSETTGLNLDVQFAAPQAGTPLVLFTPHALYNQRFQKLEPDDAGFQLAPRHANSMCVTEMYGGAEIWPCNTDLATQRLELVDCRSLTTE